jgi:hypothetical protein
MSSSLRSNKREGGGSIQYRLVAERMTKGRVGVSSWDWLHGAQVSKARPGAPFYCYRRSELTLPRLLLGVADCHPNRRSQGPAANPKVMKNASVQQPLSIEPLPFPLSSRAKPRDLRFRSTPNQCPEQRRSPCSQGLLLSIPIQAIKPRCASIFPAVPQGYDPATPAPGP